MLGIKFLVNPIVSKRRASIKTPWFAGVLFSILFTACAPPHGSPLWFVSQPYSSRDAWLVEQCSFNSIDNAKLEDCKATLAKEMWAQGEVQNAERQERRKKMAQAFAEGFNAGFTKQALMDECNSGLSGSLNIMNELSVACFEIVSSVSPAYSQLPSEMQFQRKSYADACRRRIGKSTSPDHLSLMMVKCFRNSFTILN